MSFMDIMNIMKVSSSKFVFTLIAVAALFVGGSLTGADAREDPTFTAIAISVNVNLKDNNMKKITNEQL